MWMANAATIAPATDTADGRLHIVPANLCSSLHRGQEAQERTEQFHALLQQVPKAHIHAALPPVWPLRDEGAANHMRLSCRHSSKAMHVFVHGPDAESSPTTGSIGRQSRLASNLIAQTMRLPPESVYLAQQTSRAIQSGVFHNDVIATSHGSLLLLHEFAFENQSDLIHDWQSAFRQITGLSLSVVVVSDNQLPLAEAVRTYLFNSQLIDLGDGAMELICPEECRTSVHVQALIPSWIADPNNPIQAVSYLSLQQSMSNGGGPACLRLRVPMLEEQLTQLPTTLRLTTRNVDALKQCIETWYPETLTIQDLARSDFAEYAHRTVDAIHEALSFRNQSSNS
jgi:succinylarginine dihydrolase